MCGRILTLNEETKERTKPPFYFQPCTDAWKDVFIYNNFPDTEVGILRCKLKLASMSVSCQLRKKITLKATFGVRTHNRQEESHPTPT